MHAMTKPSISVVIPAYNRAKTINYCLDSVLAQTYSPLEVIVVDDCSTDNTVKVVMGCKEPGIRCIVLEKNSGAQAARNRGIHAAKGDWIAFQDSDDEWHQEKLEKQVDVLAKMNFDPWTVVHTDALWVDNVTGKQIPARVPGVEGDNVYPILLSAPGTFFPAMLVSRIALEKINYLDENVPSFQEWDTSIRLSKYCRFVHLNEPLFTYHLHQGETISKDIKRDVGGYQYIIGKFEADIKAHCGEETWERHLWTQLHKCLEFKLWRESDVYFKQIPPKLGLKKLWIYRQLHIRPSRTAGFSNTIKQRLLHILRLFHFQPSHLSRIREFFYNIRAMLLRKEM
jgi:glycosyltransferase involved in cell wall biosynthesis